ncbi:MAG: GDSL-type esterase/lipase family protein [Bacilli bacterium]
MKKKLLLLSLLAVSIISSCGAKTSFSSNSSPDSASSIPSSFSDSSFSSSEKANDVFDNIKGSFEFTDASYISSSDTSLMLFKEKASCGTFSFSINSPSTFGENGMVLFANEASYYYLGTGIGKKFNLIKYENNQDPQIYHSESLSLSKNDIISVFFDSIDKYLEVYLDDEFFFSFNVPSENELGEQYGFSSTIKGTTFLNIVYLDNVNSYDNNPDYFSVKKGDFNSNEKGLISLYSNSLCVNESKELTSGSIEATMNLGSSSSSDSGIVFGLSDNDQSTYWEGKNISYYFFFTSLSGLAYVGKTDNGQWSILQMKQIPDFSNSGTYTLKAVFDGKYSTFYLNGEKYFSNIQSSPLTGGKWGLRAGKSGVVYTKIKAHSYSLDVKKDDTLDVVSGGFDSFEGNAVSTESKSFGIVKNSLVENGTINVTFTPGNANNGIAFRITRPSVSSFYESETGLSYYWLYCSGEMMGLTRYENGQATKLKMKYINAGVNNSLSYNLKIVLDGSDIYVYMRDTLRYYIHEDNPLTGKEFGIKAELPNCFISSISTSNSVEHEKNQVLVFGHSYMELWKSTYKEDLAIYDDVNDIGIGGSIASQWNETYDQEVITYQPRLGIYAIGINDLSCGVSPATTTNNVETLLVKMKNALPDFQVVLLGVNHCTARTTIASQIHQTNILYKNLCEKYDWMFFAECEYLFCNDSNQPISTCFIDGLHPTHDSYKKLAEVIRNAAPTID